MSPEGWMPTWLTAVAVAVSLALALALAAAPALGAPPHVTIPETPPCTQSALQAGLSRGYATVSHAKVGQAFGCRNGWAYAEVNTARFTLTSVFHARAGKWLTVRRGPACSTHAVPSRIYKPACESN